MLNAIATGNNRHGSRSAAPIDTIAAAMTTNPTGSRFLSKRHHHRENG
jgi:hypothetical protein